MAECYRPLVLLDAMHRASLPYTRGGDLVSYAAATRVGTPLHGGGHPPITNASQAGFEWTQGATGLLYWRATDGRRNAIGSWNNVDYRLWRRMGDRARHLVYPPPDRPSSESARGYG